MRPETPPADDARHDAGHEDGAGSARRRIMLVSDVHCRFNLVNLQISHAERTFGIEIEAVVVLGDFGIFPRSLCDFFDRGGRSFDRPLFFIDGNHEDFASIETLKVKYADRMTHLPRASVRAIGGINFLCLGGSAYMDALNTPHGAEITRADIAACLTHEPGTIDAVVTHDCPAGIGVPGTPGFEFYGEPGFAGGLEIARKLEPGVWFFGHHHKWFEKTHQGVRYYGIPEIFKGYALLDRNLKAVTVENPVSENSKEKENPNDKKGVRKWLGDIFGA